MFAFGKLWLGKLASSVPVLNAAKCIMIKVLVSKNVRKIPFRMDYSDKSVRLVAARKMVPMKFATAILRMALASPSLRAPESCIGKSRGDLSLQLLEIIKSND